MRNSFVISQLESQQLIGARWQREALVFLGANALLVFCAQIEFPLPYSPVPITGQTFGVLLCALALGRLRATAVVAAYLLEGILGAPVFAGGAGGFAHLAGPTGGYLAGFLLAATVVGHLSDRGWDRSFLFSLAALIVGQVIIFASGLLWLSSFVPTAGLLVAGLWPFLPGAIVKTLFTFAILPSAARFVGKHDIK